MKNNSYKDLIIFLIKENYKKTIFLLIIPIIIVISNKLFLNKFLLLIIHNYNQNLLEDIPKYFLYMILNIIIVYILGLIRQLFFSNFLSIIHLNLKRKTFNIFNNLSLEKMHLNKDKVNNLSNSTVFFINIIYTFIYFIFIDIIYILIRIIIFNKNLSLFFIFLTLILIYYIYFNTKKFMKTDFALNQQEIYNQNTFDDIHKNSLLEKLLNLKEFSSNLFNKLIEKESKLMNNKFRSTGLMTFYINIFGLFVFVFLTIKLFYLPINNLFKIEIFYLFINFFNSLQQLPNFITILIYHVNIIHKNKNILQEKIIKNQENFSEKIISLELKNISFHYNEVKILNNYSYKFSNGIYLVKGKSGTGKTTFLNLVSSITTIQKGKIFINNKNIKNYNILSSISYLCQNDYIYNRSVKENLKMNKNIDEIKDYIHNFHMENILDHNCGINGENISGGEKKRIGFLRMLNFHKDGNLIILDEPFNGLDMNLIKLLINFIIEKSKDHIILVTDHTNQLQDVNHKSIELF